MIIQEVNKAIEDYRDGCKKIGQQMLIKHQSIPIMFSMLIQDHDEFHAMYIPELAKVFNEDKNKFVFVVRKLIKEFKPIATAIITEAWLVKRKNQEDYDFNKRVSEQDDKIEVLIVQSETFQDVSIATYNIIRNGDKIELETDEDLNTTSKDNVQGNFSDLLKENYERFHVEIEENLKKNLN